MICVEIVCDGHSRTCHSKHGRAHPRPSATGENAPHVAKLAIANAMSLGWISRRQPMRTPRTAYLCPNCQRADT